MEQIAFLLSSTGLSADDLIKKLSEYKNLQVNDLKNGANELQDEEKETEKTEFVGLKNKVCEKTSSKEELWCDDVPPVAEKPMMTEISIEEEVIEEEELIMESNKNMLTINMTLDDELCVESPKLGEDYNSSDSKEYSSNSSNLLERFGYTDDDEKSSSTIIIDDDSQNDDNSNSNYTFDNAKKSTESDYTNEKKESDNIEENNKTDNSVPSDDMRQQLLSQLQQLRMKKNPLVDIAYPVTNFYSQRMPKKSEDDSVEKTSTPSKSIDRVTDPKKDEIITKESPKKHSHQVLNDFLTSRMINLTKTNDYKQIKGWRRKKIIIDSPPVLTKEEPIKMHVKSSIDSSSSDNVDKNLIDPQPSCSYKSDRKSFQPPQINNVFASNNLDGFLNLQKDLKISYNVPNLKSSNRDTINLLDDTVINIPRLEAEAKRKTEDKTAEEQPQQKKEINGFKPRTLAEKRKLLETGELEKKTKKVKNQQQLSAATPAPPPAPDDSGLIYSLIYCRGKKYRVPTKYKKNVYLNNERSKKMYKYVPIRKYKKPKIDTLAAMNTKDRVKLEEIPKKKPSIYDKAEVKSRLKYMPGPLSKKASLVIGQSTDWKPIVKKLPQVVLHVTPEFGKEVHPRARQFMHYDSCEITSDRLEFALTALRCPRQNELQTYKFKVPYEHNQKYILLQEPIAKTEKESAEEPKKSINQGEVNSVVRSVVTDLLNCVEIKEIESSIIQEDPDRVEVNTDDTSNAGLSNKVSKKTQFFKKATKRTSSELKRLNVKFIEVNIEEKDEKPVDCPNEYCKLGCVCRSLSSVAIPSDHCGETKCMFECICKFKKNQTNSLKVVVPPGTDILSDTTVSRLQNEAKKNLARVEKEFTQTVIQAYNQTIVVGDNIDRKKRSLKVPKKYKDYLELSELDFERESDDKKATKRCDVRMCCLEVPQIIPYCLEHYLYDCHCKGEAEYTKAKPILEAFDAPLSVNAIDRDEEMLQDRIQSTKEKIAAEKSDVLLCARTKGISTDYYAVRNRTKVFKKKLIKKLMLVPEEIPDGVMLGAWVEVTDKREKISVKTQSEGVMTLYEPLSKLKSRRKQNLKTREQLAQDFAIQRRKRAKVLHSSSNKRSVGLYKPSPMINARFAKLMGEDAEKSEFMLFVWSSLLNKFEENMIQIWYATPISNKVKYIITEPTKRPINGFENIRVFESRPADTPIKLDLVRWIYEKVAPSGKDPDDVLVILKTANLYWEICGICAKNSKKEENLVVVDVDVDSVSDNSKSIIINVDPQQSSASQTHPPLPAAPATTAPQLAVKKEEPKVIFSHGVFQSRYLLPFKWTSNEQMGYVACLPNVQDVCKWYVLQANTRFQMLTFGRNNYRIKATDIQAVIKLSKKVNKTIIIDTDSMSFNDSHKEFGIYIDPKYSSVLFIGPYLFYEKLDVYKVNSNENKELITDSLDIEDGCWYHQVRRTQYNHQLLQRQTSTAPKQYQEILPKPSHKMTKQLTISPKQQQPQQSKPILSDFIDLTQDQPMISHPAPATPHVPSCSPRSILKTNVLKVNISDEKVAQKLEETASKQSAASMLKLTSRLKSTTQSTKSLPTPTPKNTSNSKHVTKIKHLSKSTARPMPHVIALQNSLPKLAPKIATTSKPLPTLAPKPIASPPTKPVPAPTLKLMPLSIPKTISDAQPSLSVIPSTSVIQKGDSTRAAVEETKSAVAAPTSPELHIDLHSLYETRLKYLMQTHNMRLPNNAEPVAFQVNFTDGLVHGYKLDNMHYVYWPGENMSRRCFKNINNAIQWMKTEIKASFIMVPESFDIVVSLIEKQDYMTALGRQTINAKYFSHLCIVGLFGILKMNDVANYLFDNPNLNQNSELVSSLLVNDLCDPVFKRTMIDMLEGCELHYMDLLNRCMLQLRSHIASESTKCRELTKVKERLKSRRKQLTLKRNILEIGHSQQMLPKDPLAIDEVICLDSDDETEDSLQQQEKIASSEVVTIDTSESGGGKIVVIKLDDKKDAPKKRPASAPLISAPEMYPVILPPVSGRNKRRSRELPAAVQMSAPKRPRAANSAGNNSAEIEQIDLSYISVDEVRSFLGANGDGAAVQVTHNQLRQLKALSMKKPRSLADLKTRKEKRSDY